MHPSLNYKDDDEKFILLGKVFEFVENEKTKNILSRAGFRKRHMAVICIKIFFMSLFFNYELSKVIDELNKKEELRNFAKIYDVPTEYQVSEYFSRFNILNFFKFANSLLSTFFKPHINKTDEYIVDATPVECDINVIKQFIKNERLKKLGLKWGYSTTKKYFIGYKVTIVLEKTTLTPVSIFIHPGAPNDSKIFERILKELKRRQLIKKGDIIYFDRGYFSHKNYQIAINIYRIIPIIFPKSQYDINKIKDTISIPLDSYKDMSTFEETKKEIKNLVNQTVQILSKWKDYKPDRGIIEDFFKVAKDAFGLGKFHSYTDKSMVKNILLCLLLTTIVVQCGFKTKTQLQRLSEGYIDFEPPKTNKKKKDDEPEEKEEKNDDKQDVDPQQKLEIGIKEKITNLFNYSSRKSLKSKNTTHKNTKNSKSKLKISQSIFTYNLGINIPYLSISKFFC